MVERLDSLNFLRVRDVAIPLWGVLIGRYSMVLAISTAVVLLLLVLLVQCSTGRTPTQTPPKPAQRLFESAEGPCLLFGLSFRDVFVQRKVPG